MSIFLFGTGKIFQNFTTETISNYSQEFMYGYIPSLFFYIIFDSTRNVFNAYKKFSIPNQILSFTYGFHIIWLWLLMKYFDLDMLGLGLSRSVTEFLNAILIIGIVKYKSNIFK